MEDRRRWLQILVPALLVGTTAVLMLGGLTQPDRIIFDETYYVNDARDMLEQGVERGFVVHPPVGKQMIAMSIRLFGDNPAGWRMLGGIAGTVCVLLTYLMGKRLFRRTAPAALAALLVAVDGVFLVQARTAMLDIYLALWIILGAWALLVHAQRTRAADEALAAADPGPHDRLPPRDIRFLVLAGVAFGLAAATKWSGVLALGAGGLVAIAIEVQRRRRLLSTWHARPGRGIVLIAATLVAVPLATYLVTWTPWMMNFGNSYQGGKECGDTESCSTPVTTRVAGLWRFHKSVYTFHSDLDADHSYRAEAWTWPVLARPVVYYYETCSQDRFDRVQETEDDGSFSTPEPCIVDRGQAGEVLAVGNPVLWWLFLPSLLVLVGASVRGDPRAAYPLTFYAAQFLPWLIVSRPVFSFYAVPMVPFMALGIGAVTARLADREDDLRPLLGGLFGVLGGLLLVLVRDLTGSSMTRPTYGLVAAGLGTIGAVVAARTAPPDTRTWVPAPPSPAARWTIAIIAVLAVGVAVYFLPIWLGVPLDQSAVRGRWWFRGWI